MERQSMQTSTLDMIHEQLARSRHKYPGNEHMLAAALESMGSLARALLCGEAAATHKEAAQVCAILIRLIEEGDWTFGARRTRQPR